MTVEVNVVVVAAVTEVATEEEEAAAPALTEALIAVGRPLPITAEEEGVAATLDRVLALIPLVSIPCESPATCPVIITKA